MPNRREQIMKCAADLFTARRYHEVRLDDICQRAGVGKGTIYRYFENKEDLYYQIILSGLDELCESLDQLGQRRDDVTSALQQVAATIARFHTKRHSLFALLHVEQLRRSPRRKELRRQWREKSGRIAELVAAIIRRGAEEGRYRDHLNPAAGARLLLSMLHSALRHSEHMPKGDNLALLIVDIFENGLCRKNTSPGTSQ